ncbi:MAG: acetylornithine transaminase [Chloroflexi bacterium]|nr:acetylornithine transaminase [Chloroflexota bacterium]
MGNIPVREATVHMTTYRRQPLTLVRGQGTRVWDDEGRSYLDFIAGIAVDALGHAHPGLTEVIAKQAGTLIQVSNLFYTEPQIELAELLVGHSALDRVFFCNSGAEANEAAIKMARKWGILNRNGAYEIIATHNGFHGRTLGSVAATGTPRYRDPFGPMLPGFVFVDFDDVEAIKAATTANTAAVLLEPVQGEGGVNVPAPDYLKRVREWCDQQGILLILDEVQTGTGRTGTMWAYEQAGMEPDIMTLAKGLGGGVPIGAMLAKNACAIFEPGDHGSTFGGNALSTAAGAYVVRQLLEGGVLANVTERGDQLERRLAGLEDRSPLVAGQRGVGLLRGLVFTTDIAADVATKVMARGLLVNPVRPNVIRLLPPLNVSAEEIDEAVDIIDAVLAEVAAG